MSIERAKVRQHYAREDVAAIGRIKIEPTDGTPEQLEGIVEILGLQTRALYALCLSMRDVFIALDNRDPDTETGPDDEVLTPSETEPGVQREPGAQTEPDLQTQTDAEAEPSDPPGDITRLTQENKPEQNKRPDVQDPPGVDFRYCYVPITVGRLLHRKERLMQRNSFDIDLEWFLLNPDRGHSWFSRLIIKPKEK